MNDNDTKRLSRLTAILTQLQTKRLLTATKLSAKFSVSIRTIYRDIRALEQAGVPILTEDGRGYTLMKSYRISPVMFTKSHANALILAEQLVLKNKDALSLKDYIKAIEKVFPEPEPVGQGKHPAMAPTGKVARNAGEKN